MVRCSVYFLVVGFTFGLIINGSVAINECKKALGYLSNCQNAFVYCTVDNSWPKAESCVQCFSKYNEMVKAYSALVNINNCSEQILNRNRLNMVYFMQKTLVDIWNRGFCDDCFEDNSISNSTLEFNRLKTDLENCLQNQNKAIVCKICAKYYLALNDFYKDMDNNKSGEICFDTQDAMNETRSKWSKDLNCCHREYSQTLFLIGSTIFGSLPFIFYFGMYFYTKRTERNHQVLDESSVVDMPSTSAGVSSRLPASPNTNSNFNEYPAPSSSNRITGSALADDIESIKKIKAIEDDRFEPTENDKQITSSQQNKNNLINL